MLFPKRITEIHTQQRFPQPIPFQVATVTTAKPSNDGSSLPPTTPARKSAEQNAPVLKTPGATAETPPTTPARQPRGRPTSTLRRRRRTLLGMLIRSICHLVILSLFFWAVRLATQTQELQPIFDTTPTVWKMLSLLGGWSQFWLVSVGLATFTFVSWPFHGFFIKMLGILPLLYGMARQLV